MNIHTVSEFSCAEKNNKRMRVNTPDIQAAVNIHNHNWTNYTAVADITRFKNILKTYFLDSHLTY